MENTRVNLEFASTNNYKVMSTKGLAVE